MELKDSLLSAELLDAMADLNTRLDRLEKRESALLKLLKQTEEREAKRVN